MAVTRISGAVRISENSIKENSERAETQVKWHKIVFQFCFVCGSYKQMFMSGFAPIPNHQAMKHKLWRKQQYSTFPKSTYSRLEMNCKHLEWKYLGSQNSQDVCTSWYQLYDNIISQNKYDMYKSKKRIYI